MTKALPKHQAPPLFEQVLPQDFASLPEAWRKLAEVHEVEHFAGVASVERGAGLLSRTVGWAVGFPHATRSTVVRLRKEKTPQGETWIRDFGGGSFRSHLSRREDDGPGVLRERFGPLTFVMRLRVENDRVYWPVESCSLLGIPMPRMLRPRSETFEKVGADGRFRFDVRISLPVIGFVVRYRGWLEPAQAVSVIAAPGSPPNSMQSPFAQRVQPDDVAPDAARLRER